MNTPNLKITGMIVGVLAAWVSAGCASTPTAEAQVKSVPFANSMPSPQPVAVAGVRPEHGPGWSPWQVEVSARYVRIQGALPEAKGPLTFLADEAALKAGTIKLTRAQADAALAELARITGQREDSSPTVTVVSGGAAKIGIGFAQQPQKEAASGVRIMVGGNEMEFRTRNVGAELAIRPRVLVDGLIQIYAEMQVATFDGFIKYPSKTVKIPTTGQDASLTVKVPEGFYQPVFSTIGMAAEVKLALGEVVVLKAEEDSKEIHVPDGTERVLQAENEPREKKTLVIFLTAKALPNAG